MEVYTVFIFLSTVVYATCQTTYSATSWTYTQKYAQPCRKDSCFGLEYKSVAYMYYSGIFFTKREILKKELQWRKEHQRKWGRTNTRRKSRSRAQGYHDYDLCCPTHLSHRCESHLNNIHGNLRAIVHMVFLDPPRFQWYPHAECVDDDGSCSGECRLETITVDLLVYKLNSGGWPFEFDTFEVPGYCSCKSS